MTSDLLRGHFQTLRNLIFRDRVPLVAPALFHPGLGPDLFEIQRGTRNPGSLSASFTDFSV